MDCRYFSAWCDRRQIATPLPAAVVRLSSARSCVQVRKIAIKIKMTAITATKYFVNVTNV